MSPRLLACLLLSLLLPGGLRAQLGFEDGLGDLREWAAGVGEAFSGVPAMVRRFAPILRQDTAGGGDQDWITAIDFDGNWDSDDNWENQGETRDGRRRFPHRATVYYSVVETETHAFVVYAWFHPRDWSGDQGFRSFVNKVSLGKIPESAHENDLEGAMLVLEKGPEIRLVAVETVFHRIYKKYSLDERYQLWEGESDRDMPLYNGRPVVALESHGHGAEAWDGEPFPGKHDDGVVYLPGLVAGDPEDFEEVGEAARFEADRGGRVREVPYRLVPLITTLWPRALEGEGETFARAHALEVGPGQVVTLGSVFRGTNYGDHAANAPWGWTDEDSGAERGEMPFAPAAMIARHFRVPEGYSLSYTRHDYRDALGAGAS